MADTQLPKSTGSTYAIGDVHGEVTLLRHLLALLDITEQDTLVFLGDCVDRGEDSVATVQLIREVQQQHPACICLRGNHEDAWLAHWNGLRFDAAPGIDGALEIWENHQGKLPFFFGDWMETTRIEYEDEHAYYVHAGLLPGHPIWRTPDFLKIWGPKGFLESDYDWGKPVVFGHWPQTEPILQPNKIGLDTQAYQSGILTAIRLPDRQLFQVRRA